MSTTALELARQYTSFSGADIKVVIEGEIVGALQAISYAVQREKAPIYVMGRVDPLSFSRGKRGIAGTLITLMLDNHFMYDRSFRDARFVADNDEGLARPVNRLDATPALGGGLDDLVNASDVPFNAGNLSDSYHVAQAWYVDQLPPFDAVIVAANEYGQAANMRIYGIEILNEGSGFSIDDVVIESQMTYVARTIAPWQKLGGWNFTTHEFQQTVV